MAFEDYLLAVIVFVLVAVAVKDYVWNRRWLYYNSLRLKGPLGLPFIGSVRVLLGSGNLYKVFKRLTEQYQDIYKFWIGEKLLIMSTRPKDVENVMKTCLEKDEYLYQHLRAVIGDSLVTAELSRWKKHRKMVGSTLGRNRALGFVEIFGRHTEGLVKKLELKCGGGNFDVKDFLHTNAVSMAFETLMDHFFESEKQILEIANWTDRLAKLSVIRTFAGKFLWKFTPLAKEFDRKRTILRNIIREAILKKETQETRKTSLLFHLNEATKSDESWSFEDKTDLCQTMINASSDTISSAFCFIVAVLGVHKDIQERVYQEQVAIFNGSKRPSTAEDLNQMVYLGQVINETLRLFPAAPIFGRAITRDIQLDGNYTLPKGCIFLTNVSEIHRNPKFWPNPLKFDPDRFLPEETLKRPANVFLPFSIGTRNCIGIHYAMGAMKVVMSKLVRHFEMTSPLASLEEIGLVFQVVVQMEGGCQIALEPRTK